MDKINLNPQKIKALGCINPRFDDDENRILDEGSFEDHMSSTSIKETTMIQKNRFTVLQIAPNGEDINLTVTQSHTKIMPGGTCTFQATLTNTNDEPLENMQVLFWEQNKILKTLETNSQGIVTYQYKSKTIGKHTIRIRTIYQNGYNSTSTTKYVTVQSQAELSINPQQGTVLKDESIEITALLLDSTGKAIVGRQIDFYANGRKISTNEDNLLTDATGRATYTFTGNVWGVESKLRLEMDNDFEFTQNRTRTIQAVLYDENNTRINNQNIDLWLGSKHVANAKTNTNGVANVPANFPQIYTKEVLYATYDGTYNTRSPACSEIYTIDVKPAANVTLTSTKQVIRPNEPINITVQLSSDNTKYNWKDSIITFKEAYNTPDAEYTTITSVTTDKNGKATLKNYHHSITPNWYLIAEFEGDSTYGKTTSTPLQIKIQYEECFMNFISPNTTNLDVQTPYSLQCKITDATGKALANEPVTIELVNSTTGGVFESATLVENETSNNKGVVSVGFTPQLRGGFYLRAIHYNNTSSGYGAKIYNKYVRIEGYATRLSFTSNNISITTGNRVTVTGALLKNDDDTPITTQTIHFYNGNTEVGTATTTAQGTYSFQYPEFNTTGTYTLYAVFSGNSQYINAQSGKETITVSNKSSATMTVTAANVKINTNTTLTAQVPSTANGKFYFKIIQGPYAGRKLHSGTLTQNSGTVTKTIKLAPESSSSTRGYVATDDCYYAIYLEDDTNFANSRSAGQPILIYTNPVITTADSLTASVGQDVVLNGSILDQYGDPYTGYATINVFRESDSETVYTNEISVTSGAFQEIISTTRFKASRHTISVQVNDTNSSNTKTTNLIMNRTSTGTLTLANKTITEGNTATLTATVSSDADGEIVWYVYNENNQPIQIARTAADEGTITNDTRAVSCSTNNLVDWNAGQHTYYAQLENDSKYNLKSENKTISIRNNGTITVDDVRCRAGNTITVKASVLDSLNKPYTGNLEVTLTEPDNTSTTETVDCVNGVATITVNNISYEERNTYTQLQWNYTYNSSLYTTKTSYIHHDPSDIQALCLDPSHTINTTQINTWETKGVTDIYVRVKNNFNQIDSLITQLTTLNKRNQFRVHAVLYALYDGTTRYDTTTALPTRITAVESRIEECLAKDLDGITFDQLYSYKYPDGELINTLSEKWCKIIHNDDEKWIVGTMVAGPLDEQYNMPAHGVQFKTLAQYFDFIHVQLNPYKISTIPTDYRTYWISRSLYNIRKSAGKEKILPIIYAYKIDSSSVTPKAELESYIKNIKIYGALGYILYRPDLPPELPGKTSTIYNTAHDTTISLTNFTDGLVSKQAVKTGGIKAIIRDLYEGYCKGGETSVKIDDVYMQKTDGTGYNKVLGSWSEMTMLVNIDHITNGTHTLQIRYGGSPSYHFKSSTNTYTITVVD